MGVDERCWSQAAQDRHGCRNSVRSFVAERQVGSASSHRSDVDSLVCSNCGFTTRNASGLSRHMNSKHGLHQQASFACVHCGLVCGWQSALTRHLTEHAQPAVPAPRAHSCARFGQTFQGSATTTNIYGSNVRCGAWRQMPAIAERTGSGSAPHARALSGAPRTSASIGRDAVSDLNLRLPRLVNVMLTPERCLASFVEGLWAYHEVRCPQRPER